VTDGIEVEVVIGWVRGVIGIIGVEGVLIGEVVSYFLYFLSLNLRR
jgi:hypothetical protein